MKLEVIHPVSKNHIFPATVCKVFNNKYFLVEIDDMRDPEERSIVRLSCHGNQIGIFPITWCQSQGIKLSTPRGMFKHLTKYCIWLSWEHFQTNFCVACKTWQAHQDHVSIGDGGRVTLVSD